MKLETRLANIIFFVLLAQTPGVFNTNVFMGDQETEAVQWNLTTLDRNLTIISEGAEGEESLVLGVSRDNVQGEEGGRGFVEYEDYQEGDADLLPDPGLTVDYEEEGWHGWQEGLGGPGLWHHRQSASQQKLASKQKFHREPDTPTLIISLVLGVAGLLILVLLLSMVFITLAESREQQLVSEQDEEGEGEEGMEEEMLVTDTTLWGLVKSRWARVGLPLAGLRARLEERNYIQVI